MKSFSKSLLFFSGNLVFGISSFLFILSCNSRWEQSPQLMESQTANSLDGTSGIQQIEKKKLMKILN